MQKIKSSKVALFLNANCAGGMNFTAGKVTNNDGTISDTSSTKKYVTDIFMAHNGENIKIDGGSQLRTGSFFIQFFDADKNFLTYDTLVISKQITVYKIDEDRDDICYCRFCFDTYDISATKVDVVSWARMGKGIVSLPISYGAKTTSECYVSDDNATTTVDGYEVACDVEQTAIKGDAIFDYVDNIRKTLKTGSECETEALILPVYDFTESEDGLTGTAQKFGATVSVTDFELNGGEIAKIKYKVSFNGDPQNVTLTIADGEIQPSAEIGTASTGGTIIDVEDE